jgi:hypothetical protein
MKIKRIEHVGVIVKDTEATENCLIELAELPQGHS